MNLESVLSSLSNPNWIEVPDKLRKHQGVLMVTTKERQPWFATDYADPSKSRFVLTIKYVGSPRDS